MDSPKKKRHSHAELIEIFSQKKNTGRISFKIH